jgi:hypothetical protein
MRIIVNGREREVPSDERGNVQAVDVRRAANVPDNRAIIMQKPTGENMIVPKNGHIAIDPYANFIDSPTARRGNR